MSYDDGVRQDKRLISIMKKYGLKGTFNINSGLFGEEYTGVEKGRMSKQEILDLYLPAKMEVAVHGYQHMSLADVDSSISIYDIVNDRKELETMFGRIMKGLAYANGSYNDETISLLKTIGMDWARTAEETESFDLPNDWMKWTGTCHHDHPRLMELAQRFIESQPPTYYWAKRLQLFYVWGHSYEFDDNNNWETIEKFAEYIGGHDDIWYATNGEIFEYLKACELLEFSADGSMVKNPTAIDVYIDYIHKQRIVPAGETIRIASGEIV